MKTEIKPQELRIGNLFYPNLGGEIDKTIHWIQTINMTIGQYVVYILPEFSSGSGLLCLYLDNIKPIPITQEWLLKAGFEKEGMDFNIKVPDKNHDILSISKWPDGRYFYNGYLGKELKYWHELQNLFFALTGKELTFL